MSKAFDTIKRSTVFEKKLRIVSLYLLVYAPIPTVAALFLAGFATFFVENEAQKNAYFLVAGAIGAIVTILLLRAWYCSTKRKNFMSEAQEQKPDTDVFEELEIKALYDKDGILHDWANVTFNYNGEDFARIVWGEFIKSGLLPKIQEPVIFSPSAARGKYEKIAFHFLVEGGYVPNFILTDVSNEERVEDETIGNATFVYVAERLNVNKARAKFVEGRPPFDSLPNVIWDLKGGLWYAANKKVNRSISMLDLLKEYHQTLASGGVILIDAYEQCQWLTDFNLSLYHTHKRLIGGYAEDSTYTKFEKQRNSDSEFAKKVDQLFRISRPFGKGKYRSIVLVKK